MSVKLQRVLDKLSSHYKPFTDLSKDRLSEVCNLIRFIELREGEILQLRGTEYEDYLYVLEGTVEIVSSGSIHTICTADNSEKKPYVLPSAPSIVNLIATKDCIVCHAERKLLDDMIAWDEVYSNAQVHDVEASKKMEKVRNSLVFRRLPLEVVESAFSKMEFIEVESGDNIITIGEEGDSYYIITDGTAEAFHIGLYDDEPVKVADLTDGDAFGCEAIISGSKRNETVKATTNCCLLKLEKECFEEIIHKSLINTVNPTVAKSMIDTGYTPLDVRYEEEFDDHHIEGAQLMPLHELRNRMQELDKNAKYIVYCHAGGRSAVAALLLAQNKFDVVNLDGGIRNWPFETAEQNAA